MAELHRLENPAHRASGGVLTRFPSGYACTVTWRSEQPVHDTLALAKSMAASIVQRLIETGHAADLDRTNVPSLVAGLQRMVVEWNQALRGSGFAICEEGGGGVGESPAGGEGGHPPLGLH